MPWHYWTVCATDSSRPLADQGALIRVHACYTPPDVARTALRHQSGTPGSIVLQQSALPTIVDAPRSVLVRTGQTANFSVDVSGLPAPTLQWQTRAANSTGAWTDVAPAPAPPRLTTPPRRHGAGGQR